MKRGLASGPRRCGDGDVLPGVQLRLLHAPDVRLLRVRPLAVATRGAARAARLVRAHGSSPRGHSCGRPRHGPGASCRCVRGVLPPSPRQQRWLDGGYQLTSGNKKKFGGPTPIFLCYSSRLIHCATVTNGAKKNSSRFFFTATCWYMPPPPRHPYLRCYK